MANNLDSSSKADDHRMSGNSEASQLVKISSLNELPEENEHEKENARKESLKPLEDHGENVSIGFGSFASLLAKNRSQESSLNSRELFDGSMRTEAISVKNEKAEKTISISEEPTRLETVIPETEPLIPEEFPFSVSQFLPPVPSELSHRSHLMPQTPSEFSRQSDFPENFSAMFSAEFGSERRATADSSFVDYILENFARSEKSVDMSTDEITSKRQDMDNIQAIQGFDIGTPLIDRKMYYEMYKLWEKRKKNEKIKNNFLQRGLAQYYIQRRMWDVLRETSFKGNDEIVIRYNRDLERLGQLYEYSEREKSLVSDEINHMMEKRDATKNEYETLIQTLIQFEQDYAKCLTYEKTGRTNMDKLVERLIKRQKVQTALLTNLRLQYIKLRNKVQEKLEAIDALDHLGPGFRIMDYIQLKHDNRNLYDKFEEKETELIRTRQLCRHSMQILAHYREKRQVLDLDMERLRETLEGVENEFNDAREQLMYLKHERDYTRNAIKRIRLDHGLLTFPALLRDMETSVNEADSIKKEIGKIKTSYYMNQQKINEIRKKREKEQWWRF